MSIYQYTTIPMKNKFFLHNLKNFSLWTKGFLEKAIDERPTFPQPTIWMCSTCLCAWYAVFCQCIRKKQRELYETHFHRLLSLYFRQKHFAGFRLLTLPKRSNNFSHRPFFSLFLRTELENDLCSTSQIENACYTLRYEKVSYSQRPSRRASYSSHDWLLTRSYSV